MRFHTTHLMGFIAVVALILGVVRHPDTLWAAVVPLVGGVFVVLPVLGTAELFTPRSSSRAEIGWPGAIAAAAVGVVGAVLGLVVMAALVAAFDR